MKKKPSIFGTGWKHGTFGRTLRKVASRALKRGAKRAGKRVKKVIKKAL